MSSQMAVISASAAGPCCQRAWLPTTQSSDPSAAASVAGVATRASPMSVNTRCSTTAVSVAISAAVNFAIARQCA